MLTVLMRGPNPGSEEMKANLKMLRAHCPQIVSLADGQLSHTSLRSQMPVTFRTPLWPPPPRLDPRHVGAEASSDAAVAGKRRPLMEMDIMLMLIILGSFAVK